MQSLIICTYSNAATIDHIDRRIPLIPEATSPRLFVDHLNSNLNTTFGCNRLIVDRLFCPDLHPPEQCVVAYINHKAHSASAKPQLCVRPVAPTGSRCLIIITPQSGWAAYTTETRCWIIIIEYIWKHGRMWRLWDESAASHTQRFLWMCQYSLGDRRRGRRVSKTRSLSTANMGAHSVLG